MRGASHKEQPAAAGTTRICPESRRGTAQPRPGMGFRGTPEVWEQRRGPRTPGGKWPRWQQPGRLNTTTVPWQGHRGRDLPAGRLILGALRRGYFGPFALCESPAIFQPRWDYFRGRDLRRPGQCRCRSPGGLEPKAMLGARSPLSRVWGGCPGSPQLPCGARDAHSRVDQPGTHPASLPPS